MNKLVIDTNILVYSKDEHSQFNSWVMRLFADESFVLYTTAKNLSEYYTVVTRGEYPKATPQEALEDIKQFISTFNIIHSSKNSLLILENLISEHRPKGLKVHDFEIAAISLSNGIQGIVTLNAKDFKSINNIKVISPE